MPATAAPSVTRVKAAPRAISAASTQQASLAAASFHSHAFSELVAQLLKDERSASRAQGKAFHAALHAVHSALSDATKPLSVPLSSTAHRGLDASLAWTAPTEVSVVGSHVLGTRLAETLVADVCAEMPDDMFREKDFRDGRFVGRWRSVAPILT